MSLVSDMTSELRTISHLLHPPLLDEAGLPSALRWFVEGFAARSKIPVDLTLPPDLGRFSSDLETTLFRIVQECLTNIHRHSESPTASISILRNGNCVILEVRDQGKGMPAQSHGPWSAPARPGVGIQGMRERVRQLGGHLEIQSGAGGTSIRAVLPIKTSAFEDQAAHTAI
jgi:signal transduction histidine kinase